ncbi:PAS domain-containing protein [Pseudarthrobacter sp. Y6]|uniref:PAS domain-containing protein n=1 Tax=Pseudarthrobacter sp. Y6 TaxID=3418422 RepID=UPI003CF1AFDB
MRASNFGALLDASPDALLAVNSDGTIKMANAASSRLFGYTHDELIGSDHRLLLSEGFRNEMRLLRQHLQVRADEQVPPREVYGLHRDGTEFAAEVAGSLLDDGGSQLLLVSVRSTEHRKGADADLREAMSLLTATLESTADGILVISSDGSVAGFNDQFLKMWSIPPELLDGDTEVPIMRLIISQVANPEAFMARLTEVVENPGAESHDVNGRAGRLPDRAGLRFAAGLPILAAGDRAPAGAGRPAGGDALAALVARRPTTA